MSLHPFVSYPEIDQQHETYPQLMRLERELRALRGAEATQKRVAALASLKDEEFAFYQRIRYARDLAEADRISANPHLIPNASERVRTLNRLRFMTPIYEIESLFARQMGGSPASGGIAGQSLEALFSENPIEPVLRAENAPAWQENEAGWEGDNG